MRYLIEKIYNKIVYRSLIKLKLKYVGRNFRLGYHSEILNPEFFSIGDNFYCGPHAYFVTNINNPVYIGKYVMFGPKCNIIGGNHDYRFEGFMSNNSNIEHSKTKIIIEDGVWVGANTTIINGAHICEGSVVGAMSLVNKFIPPYVIAGGIPVRVLKPRFSQKSQLENTLINTQSKYSSDQILSLHRELGFNYV